MTGVNGGSRAYSSPLRRRMARETRAAVLRAAHDLFVRQGYGATTVEQVAAAAGVSKPTVFTAVGNKPTLLKVVRDVAMAGDDEPVALNDRPTADAVRAEPDQDRAVTLAAAAIIGVSRRYAAVDAVLRGAAASGEEGLRELWEAAEAQRLVGARMWMTTLAAKRTPPAGFDLDAAVDELWLYMAPDQYARLTSRGWDDARIEAWFAGRVRHLLRGSAP
ncbi:MAG: helix-turn-helix domain containing protein [Pseudonocardiales bacterium]|nr:helix-turn-helix domain containing protein [Pseudonocardiales bacterium]